MVSAEKKVFEIRITNDTMHPRNDALCPYVIDNNDIFAYPNHIYHYHVELEGLEGSFSIGNGRPVSGTFKNIVFLEDTWIEDTVFKNVTFENCVFKDVDCIRWCKFDNCQFINCSGNFQYARVTTWKKNCKFVNSSFLIDRIDEYVYINSKRHSADWMNDDPTVVSF